MKNVYRKISFILIVLLMVTPIMNIASAANPSAAGDTTLSLFNELSKQSLENAEQKKKEWLQEREQADPTLIKSKERSGQSSELGAQATDYKPNDKVQVIVEMTGQSISEKLVDRQVDFKDANAAQVKTYESEIHTSQQQVLDTIDSMNVWLMKGYQFKNMLNAFSGEVLYRDIHKIKKIPGVKDVHIAQIYDQKQVESEPDYFYGAPNIGIEQSWDTGLQGEDITIAIIDTGVNYYHPAFGGNGRETLALGGKQDLSLVTGNGQGYNERIIGGYNWADGNNDIVDRTGFQHGVHVAGIAAGYDASGTISGMPFKGVAPKAKILAEKVVSNNGSRRFTYSVEYIAAIEHAVANGADVINMSFGMEAEAFVSDDPANQAIENAVKSGVVVVISAGNSSYATEYAYYPLAGMRDYATVGSPSISPSAISVAASANRFGYYDSFELNVPIESETEEVSDLQQVAMLPYDLLPSPDSLEGEFEIVDAGFGRVSDFATIDVSGKIALMERGEGSFADKTANAASNGAVAAIIYNDHREGYVEMEEFSNNEGIPAVFIRGDHGRTMKEALDANMPLTLHFADDLVLADLEMEWMTDFSSWGPEPHLNFKPNFTAPGEDVYSSVENDDYREKSGTSMAAPVVAGASALVIESFRNRSIDYIPQDVTTVLSNTADILINPETDTPYSVRQQGAGRIQVDKAVASTVWATGLNGEPGVALKAFDQSTITFSLQVKNVGNEERTYRLEGDSYIDATFVDTDDGLEYNELTLEELAGAEVSFDQETLTVPAHTTSLIDVTLQLPDDLDVNQFVDGWIYLTPTDELDDTTIIVPYFGFYGDWNQPEVIDKHWSEYESYFWETGLFEDIPQNYPLGMSMGYDYWEEYASFSPNGDGNLDVIVPKISLLRSAERLEVNLLDSQYNRLQTFMVGNHQRKATSPGTTIRKLKEWNGTLNGEVVADGQYYIQVMAKAYGVGDDDIQEYVYPVKVDTEQPIISGQLIEEDGITNLQIVGEDETGIFYCYIDIYDRNGVHVLEGSVAGDDENFMVTIPIEELPEDPYVIITAYDYAGNVTQVEAGTELPFIYHGVSTVNNTAIVNFAWSASSLVTDMTIQVDDQEERSIAAESNWRSSYPLPLTYGDHTVSIRAFDAEGELIAFIEESIEGLNAMSLAVDETITTHHHLTQPIEISYYVSDERVEAVTMSVEGTDQQSQQQINEPGKYTFYYDAPHGETVLTLQAWTGEDELLGQQLVTIRNVKLFDVKFAQEAYTVVDDANLPVTMRFSEDVDNAAFNIFNSEGQSVTDSVYISVTDAVYTYHLETVSLSSGHFTLQLDAYDANDQLLDKSNADLFIYPTGLLDYGDSESMIRTNEDYLALDWDYDPSVNISEDVYAVTLKVDGEERPLSVNDTFYMLDLTSYEDEDTVTVQITATDQEGGEGTLTYTIVRDLSAPAWIVFRPTSFEIISVQENRAGVAFEGFVYADDLDEDSVSLRVPGMAEPEHVQVESDSGFTFVNEVISFVEEGIQNIELHYRDAAGNSGYHHRKVIVDLTSPTIELTNLDLALTETEESEDGRRIFEGKTITTASSISLQGTVRDGLTSFYFGINDSQILGALGYKIEAGEADERPFHETFELSEGENEIVLHAEDRAGNRTLIHLTVTKEKEAGGGNHPPIPGTPIDQTDNQQDEGAFSTIIDKDDPNAVEVKLAHAFVKQHVQEKRESEVTIDFSELTKESFQQLRFTLEKELSLLLQESGKDILFKDGQVEIRIPNSAISDFIGEEGFQLKVKINPFDTRAGVTILSDNKTSIVSPVLEIGEANRMLSDEIAITLTYSNKLVADERKVGIYRLAEEGWSYMGIPSDQDGNKLMIKTNQLGTFAAIAYHKTFTDLSSHWAKDEIELLASMHVLKGSSSDLFAPDHQVTRAEFTAMLVRALQLPVADYQGYYRDVPADAWYAAIVESASETGIVAGWGDGTFRPDEAITREQMIVMIVRAMNPASEPLTNPIRFEDSDEISEWARTAVDWASQEGLIQGLTETAFAPRNSSSRAQAAVMIYRMLQL
ncbi:S8 family serine peptidase [Paenibacillus sp. J5C_2022]|uniref:S8 family serine peptidase n=1 Tax=Paenibacillus sp. J5C2022 TaxID=2977129 RepID=UPI0021D26AC3|nr:S8 family serine peptidase [Paenibacillus sp. J5C2022]MCU6712849.1 S8 family serine peptidase [Paenibacillus sp. J5C2022]